MKNRIKNFRKTRHFLQRQMERQIDDKVLCEILKHIKNRSENVLVVVSRKVLQKFRKQGIWQVPKERIREELFIKIDRRVLVTCFTGNFGTYKGYEKSQGYFFIQ